MDTLSPFSIIASVYSYNYIIKLIYIDWINAGSVFALQHVQSVLWCGAERSERVKKVKSDYSKCCISGCGLLNFMQIIRVHMKTLLITQ